MKLYFLLALFLFLTKVNNAQDNIKKLNWTKGKDVCIHAIEKENGDVLTLSKEQPFFNFYLNDTAYNLKNATFKALQDSVIINLKEGLTLTVRPVQSFNKGWKAELVFRNSSPVSYKIENILPFGPGNDRMYIQPEGPYSWPGYLCRSVMHPPDGAPVGVVLPDNMWHIGFSVLPVDQQQSIVALARRHFWNKNVKVTRWHSTLEEGGELIYNYFADIVMSNDWRKGLELFFRDRYLYDLDSFDDTLYQREDLAWIRSKYLKLIRFCWDQNYYDALEQKYNYYDDLFAKDHLIGHYDIYAIWPTWPRLGLDQRNQWDMYRDLPGGLNELKKQADFAHKNGIKYFLAYNPWDKSTRKEDHFSGMEILLKDIDADGLVLDTRGKSSKELQETADRVKPGIVMYSEGMAIPKHMPGIVSGRVHDAILMPPPLNLNKFIKPDFAIFRVLQLADGRFHREASICLFNGYGAEINTFRVGRPQWEDEEYAYLGEILKVLRNNHDVFTDPDWQPLIPSLKDSVWVNKWMSNNKTLYTIFSLRPEGYSGPLFEISPSENKHWVSVWNHEEIEQVKRNGKYYATAQLTGFSKDFLGSRREGSVDCIAAFPKLLKLERQHDTITFSASSGSYILGWAGKPSYNKNPIKFSTQSQNISLRNHFGNAEDKIVFQLFNESDQLIDERIISLSYGTPRLISKKERTKIFSKTPENMVKIPAGNFNFYTLRDNRNFPAPFIPLPDYSDTVEVEMEAFLMDRYPVTNSEFQKFLEESGYKPVEPKNFLAHWENGKIPKGKENHPVVYVDYNDAKAFADFYNKRLPTEKEWQYAGQGNDMRRYPWGKDMDSTLCNYKNNATTPVDKYPKGASPFGIMDMVGNIWQFTHDIYDNGAYYYHLIRGGSYYNPVSSEWYVIGGPVPLFHPQILLKVSPGFDRSATLGFRCVADIKQ